MVLWVHLLCFLVGSHVSLAWVELLVPGALVGQMLWIPVTTWVELLVLEPWLDKRSGALNGLSYYSWSLGWTNALEPDNSCGLSY